MRRIEKGQFGLFELESFKTFMKGRQDFSTDSIQRLIRKHQGAKPLDKKSKALLDPEEEEKEEKALLLALKQLVEDKKE